MERSVAGHRRDGVVTNAGARDSHESRGLLHVHASSNGEKMRTVVVEDHNDIARLVANRIATLIRERNASDESTVLGLATGSTPIGVYRELIRMHREGGLSFADVITFNLDEYYPMSKESIHSYHRFMWENLFSHIDIKPANVHIPPGDVPREQIEDAAIRYESEIQKAGGIDFQILGIGKTGHIGFNEPGSGSDSRTRLVTLDAVTRKDAAADFFGEEYVPREAVTMGVATILGAREIAIIATGEHKSTIVQRAVEGEIDVEVAATFLQRHPNTTFYLDRAAAASLTRIKTPWLIDEVEWTDELMLRAVIWLSQQTDRAILKPLVITHALPISRKTNDVRVTMLGDNRGGPLEKLDDFVVVVQSIQAAADAARNAANHGAEKVMLFQSRKIRHFQQLHRLEPDFLAGLAKLFQGNIAIAPFAD